jgi:hypothetical protein
MTGIAGTSRIILDLISSRGFAVQVELQNTRNHDDRLRPVSILKHCEAESLGAVTKESAAGALFVLDHPVTSAIPADPETRRIQTAS